MPPTLIDQLSAYGKEAGGLAAGPDFDLDEHRWRRFLIAMAELEETLDQITVSHDGGLGGSEVFFGAFLKRYHFHGSYPPLNESWKKEILSRANALVASGRQWWDSPTIRSGKIPSSTAFRAYYARKSEASLSGFLNPAVSTQDGLTSRLPRRPG